MPVTYRLYPRPAHPIKPPHAQKAWLCSNARPVAKNPAPPGREQQEESPHPPANAFGSFNEEAPMTKNRLLQATIPIMLLLLLWQGVSAVLDDSLGRLFPTLHAPTGFLLITLVVLHLVLNWNWVKANYFKQAKAHAKVATGSKP
jgi:hypothetical protein